jgi:hypothetical protein
MLSIDVEFYLTPFGRGTSVKPFVVEDGIGIVKWFEDFVAVLDIAEEKVETAEGLLTWFAFVLTQCQSHVPYALLLDQLAKRP